MRPGPGAGGNGTSPFPYQKRVHVTCSHHDYAGHRNDVDGNNILSVWKEGVAQSGMQTGGGGRSGGQQRAPTTMPTAEIRSAYTTRAQEMGDASRVHPAWPGFAMSSVKPRL
jgi:hypothetical protein